MLIISLCFYFATHILNMQAKKPLRLFSKVLILLIAVLNCCSDKGSVEFFWAVWTT